MERLADYILHLYPIDHVPLKRRITFHVLFWAMMYVIFWLLSGLSNDSTLRVITAISRTVTVSSFFYTFFYIVPYFYNNRGIRRYTIPVITVVIFYFFIAFISYTWTILVIENSLLSIVDNKKQYILNYNFYKAGFWYYFKFDTVLSDTIGNIIYSLPATFLKFSRIFAKNLVEKKQLEIDFLRLQINPHFLVNTLNNIYSLVVIEDQRSSDAILSLSNLLNYVLYESSLPMVSLEKEITFLQDFVSLEKIRSSTKVKVTMNVEGELVGDVAPLILIAFIENAFKHGGGDSTIQSFININIKIEQNDLFMEVVNSKARKASEKIKKTLGGIGLVNVQKRLASLYPNRYTLQVIPETFQHQILLKIQLTQK